MLKQEPLVFLLGGVLLQFLIPLTLGILSGPFLGAYMLMFVFFLRDGKRPVFNDLFSGLQRFGELFPFFFLSLLIMAGFLFFIVPGIFFMTWWLYALVLMADKRMTLGDAMRRSKMKVDEKGFFMHMVFLFMIAVVPAMLINIAAAVVPFFSILHLLVMPLQCGCLASRYLEQFEGIDPGDLLTSSLPSQEKISER